MRKLVQPLIHFADRHPVTVLVGGMCVSFWAVLALVPTAEDTVVGLWGLFAMALAYVIGVAWASSGKPSRPACFGDYAGYNAPDACTGCDHVVECMRKTVGDN